MKAQNGSRSVAVLILNLGARWGWFVNATLWPLYSQERSPVQVLEKAGWAPWPVWTVMKSRKSRASTSVRKPDSPASSCYLLRCNTLVTKTLCSQWGRVTKLSCI